MTLDTLRARQQIHQARLATLRQERSRLLQALADNAAQQQMTHGRIVEVTEVIALMAGDSNGPT